MRGMLRKWQIDVWRYVRIGKRLLLQYRLSTITNMNTVARNGRNEVVRRGGRGIAGVKWLSFQSQDRSSLP